MPIEIRELVIRATVITVSDASARGEREDKSVVRVADSFDEFAPIPALKCWAIVGRS